MGLVYEAFDRERNQLVALKTLIRFDAASLLRFKNEFRAIHELDHPNLVSLHELLEEDGVWFFTMELVQGRDFLSFVHANDSAVTRTDVDLTSVTIGDIDASRTIGDGLLAPAAASEVPATGEDVTRSVISPLLVPSHKPEFDEAKLRDALKQLALGIAALHSAGKVHRDIKPSNIMVTNEGRVVLLDFGLVADVENDPLRSPDRIVGTAAYIAPEAAAGGASGAAADWYAFGVLLYKALVGTVPHPGKALRDILLRKQQIPATPPRQHFPELPEDLDALCVDLLQRAPEDRPRTHEILRRLGVAGRDLQGEGESSDSSSGQAAPFVGREEELEQLHAIFSKDTKSTRVVVIHGDSGVGKSHLVDQFIKQLLGRRDDVVALSGRCYERESVAYKGIDGIADALSRYMSDLPLHAASALLPTEAGRLVKLFPALGGVPAIAAAPQEDDLPNPREQRVRMFSALRDLLVRLCKRKSVVLYVDDLQWITADSVALLQETLGHRESPPLLFVATMRPTTDAEQAQLLTGLDEIAEAHHLQLAALPSEQAAELARQLLPSGGDYEPARIAEEAAGHPLFIQELTRQHVHDSGVSGRGLTDVLWARISRLPALERRFLEIICIAGSPLAQEICASAAELDAAARVKATKTLRSAHLVRTDGVRASDTIVAYHDRIRETVTSKLDDERVRLLHQRIALSLERGGAAKSDPQRLVRHAEAAGDPKRAAAHAQAAAQHAIASMAFDQAATFLRTALRLREYSREETRTLQLACAQALVNAGRGAEAAELFVAAAEGASSSVWLDCQREATEQWLTAGHLERGLAAVSDLLGQVGVELPATPRRALTSLLWQRAKLRVRGIRWTRRELDAIPARELRRLDVYKAVGHGLGMVDPVRGMDFQSRGLLLALRTGESFRVARNLFLEASFVASQGGARSLARGKKLLERASRIDPDDPRLAPWKSIAEGCVHYFGSNFQRSIECLSRAETLWRDQLGANWELSSARVFLIWSLLRSGGLAEMTLLLDEYSRDASRRGDLYLRTTLIRSCHIRWLAADTLDAAQQMLEQARWAPPEGRYHLQHWFEFKALREMDLYVGDAVDLGSFEEQFRALQRSMLTRVITIRLDSRWLRGRLALRARGDSGAQASNSREARHMARLLEREAEPYAAASAMLLRAACDCRAGDVEGAVSVLASGIRAAEDNHLLLHAAVARRRRGELLGGSEGAELVARADEWMTTQGIANPERFATIYAPGFSPPEAAGGIETSGP